MSDQDSTLRDRLESLAEEYAEFRARKKPNDRISDSLRIRTLELITAGMSQGVVERSCGIQSSQIKLWRTRLSGISSAKPPRILEVIADAPDKLSRSARVIIEGKRIIIELPL